MWTADDPHPRTRRAGAGILLALAAAACGESATAPEPTREDAENLAILSMAASSAWGSVPPGFGRRELPCPAGGKRVIDGTVDVAEEADQVRRILVDITLEQSECAFVINNLRLETTGASHIVGETRMRVPAAGELPVMLSHEVHETGAYTTRSEGASITCDLDITHKLDPATGMIRMSGNVCGHAIDFVRPGLTG